MHDEFLYLKTWDFTSDKELDPKVVEKRIRSLMKCPRKKPLKFGMAMFENGSCPLVCYFSATVLMIPLQFMRADVFSLPLFSSNRLALRTLLIPFAAPTQSLLLTRRKFTPAETKRKRRGM
jgi:hypothetical protein